MLIHEGINRFVLIGENVLNLHVDADDYYEEWYDDIIDEGGWIMAINLREHVVEEWENMSINRYIHFGPKYNDLPWRKLKACTISSFIRNATNEGFAHVNWYLINYLMVIGLVITPAILFEKEA